MPSDSHDDPKTTIDRESRIESQDRRSTPPGPPSRFPIGAGLAAFSGAGGASLAAILEGAVFSGLMAAIVWGATGLIAANDFRSAGPPRPWRQTLRIILAGSMAAVFIAAYAGGLAALLTALLAALLGLLLVPSVTSLIGTAAPGSGAGTAAPAGSHPRQRGSPDDAATPENLDHRGYWQVNSALGGSGMWGYGFRRAYNPITGEAGEWLGPGLVRKSDDTVVRVDAEGRPT